MVVPSEGATVVVTMGMGMGKRARGPLYDFMGIEVE